MTSAPYLAQWVMSIVSSVLADYLIEKQILTVTKVRKIYTVIGTNKHLAIKTQTVFIQRIHDVYTGTVGAGLGVMGASLVGCDQVSATVYFTLGMALMGFCYPSIRINALDLSPNYSASIMALVNGLGCLSGMLSPLVVGLLTPNVSFLFSVVILVSFCYNV